ncbi:T9SS type A sorting domain-containing protein, partial [bacterium]|nr:T9SS type A sorting domain-containing protein [bacterium]
LFLTINNSTSAIDTITACDSYTWIDGVIYTLSDTTAMDTLVNAAGCDSIVSLFLTINNSTSAIDTITACDSYTWIDGVIYTLSDTTAMDTLVNAAGCDSIVSLNLTINYTQTSTDSVVANDTYTWIDGVTYTSSNNTATDTLIASNGCDSIVTLNLTLILGLNNLATLSNIKVYPNPTNGKLTIDAENFEYVEVYDVSGRLILESKLKTIDLEGQSQGLYLLKINANGTKQELKVLKD